MLANPTITSADLRAMTRAAPAAKPRRRKVKTPGTLASSKDGVTGCVSAWLPLRIVSVSNVREHWSKRARRAKEQRGFTMLKLRTIPLPALPVIVTLTRYGPRRWDSDNNVAGLKACRDGVAEALGVDDGDPRIEWRCEQGGKFPGSPKEHVVLVVIQRRAKP